MTIWDIAHKLDEHGSHTIVWAAAFRWLLLWGLKRIRSLKVSRDGIEIKLGSSRRKVTPVDLKNLGGKP